MGAPDQAHEDDGSVPVLSWRAGRRDQWFTAPIVLRRRLGAARSRWSSGPPTYFRLVETEQGKAPSTSVLRRRSDRAEAAAVEEPTTPRVVSVRIFGHLGFCNSLR